MGEAQVLDRGTAQGEFFGRDMYLADIGGWPADRLRPERPVVAPRGARLRVWATDPHDGRHLPPPGDGVLLDTGRFSLTNSGNRTLRAPKRSWKVDLDVDGGDDRVGGMSCLNLKAMYNDPAQMREALAWRLFRQAGVSASRHTVFNPPAIDAVTGCDSGGGLWDRVSRAAYLELDSPHGVPFTGRQFTNDEVYRSGFGQQELRHGNAMILGIHHYVRMRHDRAREQLAALRRTHPSGASGARFSGVPEPLPGQP